jgi:hypothetical protein
MFWETKKIILVVYVIKFDERIFFSLQFSRKKGALQYFFYSHI